MTFVGEPPDWRRSPILEGIRNYNRDDCDSTALLAQWLQARRREQDLGRHSAGRVSGCASATSM